ncbi:uncharacterized protein LOC136038970 [Artemia franciscana]|uniref:uncharacterized protein LOC136038970 n=1 Tax=Artemia franciscana TaxID=6661 RepID=UPI0032DA6B6E
MVQEPFECQCWDARNKVFTYLDLAIQILKPDGASDDTWQGSIVENGDFAKFVLLGYGNCKPLADFTPGTDNLRFQTNNFKPVPILYARFENDPPSGYTIPHGKFKPKNEPKASRHFTEEEVMRILRKAFKPPQLLTEGKTEPEVTKIEKTKMQESIPRKRSRSVAITEEFNVPKLKKEKEGNTEIELQNGRSQTEIILKNHQVLLQSHPGRRKIFLNNYVTWIIVKIFAFLKIMKVLGVLKNQSRKDKRRNKLKRNVI